MKQAERREDKSSLSTMVEELGICGGLPGSDSGICASECGRCGETRTQREIVAS